MGPSKGMPETISAAEAALMASTSWGFSWSAPRMVPTTWTSLRNPAGNEGRRGRSMSRPVRIAWSVARPSRRKNEPGIFPAAYMRSSMSTVSGKKSMPSRTVLAAVAVTSTTVSPRRATTAPSAWPASLPVSKVRVRSVLLMGADTVMASAMTLLVCQAAAGPVPSGRAPDVLPRRVAGHWQLTAGAACCVMSGGLTARPSVSPDVRLMCFGRPYGRPTLSLSCPQRRSPSRAMMPRYRATSLAMT